MNTPRRRLSDKIIDAFDHACSTDDLEVAEGLYRVLELELTRLAARAARTTGKMSPSSWKPPTS